VRASYGQYSAHGVAKRTTEFATRGWEVCFELDKYYSRLKVLQQGSDHERSGCQPTGQASVKTHIWSQCFPLSAASTNF